MPPRLIAVSTENQLYQYVDALRRNREKRHRSREFLVEGVRPIDEALRHGWPLTTLLFCRGRPLSDWARGVLTRSRTPTHAEVAANLWEQLCARDEPGELLAIAQMPDDNLGRIPIRERACIVLVDRPASPGNLGSLIRSCDAFGVDGVVIVGHAVDLYDPATLRATAGSFFAVPSVRIPGTRELRPWLDDVRSRVGPMQVVGTSERASIDISRYDYTPATVLVVGNERWGMSAGFRELCDAIVTIPMSGSASSLNLACAASVALYEIARQRHHLLPPLRGERVGGDASPATLLDRPAPHG